jgi:outer membrane protein OmpA-like peptidoglycan-associated protein
MRQRLAIGFAIASPILVLATVAGTEQARSEPQERVFFVFFAAGRDEIPAAFDADIREAACHVVPGVAVKVRGYTDVTGAADDNPLLSRRRAVQVVNQVGRYGVPCDRLKDFKGLGEENSPGQAENGPFSRRVEVLLNGPLPSRDVVTRCVGAPLPNPLPPQCEKRP